MKLALFLLSAVCAAAADDLNLARQQLDRVREQVAAGLVPAARLDEAQQAVDDAMDEETLARTLYGRLAVEDLNESQSDEMINAATRRVDRIRVKLERGRDLVAQGVAAANAFADLENELSRREQALAQARDRAALIREIAEVAHGEADSVAAPQTGIWKPKEFVDGDHLLEPKDIKALTLAFEKQFDKPLPVSARGSTAVHRAMGFDHTGRIDVALTPDSPEGAWLRKYLESKSIPYYAFRVAMAGKATAPHIHVGPGSTRIHTTD
jgi:hypothetical protein